MHNRNALRFTIQIIPKVFILGCINVLPAYRDKMRAAGPKHPYILGRTLIQPKINTEGIICFLFLLVISQLANNSELLSNCAISAHYMMLVK